MAREKREADRIRGQTALHKYICRSSFHGHAKSPGAPDLLAVALRSPTALKPHPVKRWPIKPLQHHPRMARYRVFDWWPGCCYPPTHDPTRVQSGDGLILRGSMTGRDSSCIFRTTGGRGRSSYERAANLSINQDTKSHPSDQSPKRTKAATTSALDRIQSIPTPYRFEFNGKSGRGGRVESWPPAEIRRPWTGEIGHGLSKRAAPEFGGPCLHGPGRRPSGIEGW
jgi:hypothetical protein